MNTVLVLLVIIAVLVFLCWSELQSLNKRMKERFPTAKEEEFRLAQEDPMGHWEAHKNEKDHR